LQISALTEIITLQEKVEEFSAIL